MHAFDLTFDKHVVILLLKVGIMRPNLANTPCAKFVMHA